MKFFILMAAILASTIALGQETDPMNALEDLRSLNPALITKIIGIVIALQITLYGLGEVLTRVSKYTENKWDNKLAKVISEASWILGSLISKFGYSAPKLVIEEKASKAKK